MIPKEGFRGNQYERGKEAKSASLAKGHFGNIHEDAKSASSLPKDQPKRKRREVCRRRKKYVYG